MLVSASQFVVADDATLREYYSQKYACSVDSVSVKEDSVHISGTVTDSSNNFQLGWLPIEAETTALPDESSLQALVVEQGKFNVSVPRRSRLASVDYDLLTARWGIYRKNKDGIERLSHSRYADEVVCKTPTDEELKPGSKKGLGGWNAKRLPGELEELGISAVTVNVMVSRLVSTTPKANYKPFEYQGRTYYANEAALASYDASFLEAEKRGILVSAILLVANPKKSQDNDVRLVAHPDCEEKAEYAMPNVMSKEGAELYGAILHLMADRWSRSNGTHGRIHHWIIHNEVDAGRVWTNAGEKTDIAFMELYVRSMRLTHLIARQFDLHTRAFVSLDHHWAEKGKPEWYGSKRILELLSDHCRVEGDFEWGLAYHPYPQNLFNPKTWKDDQATLSFESKKITPRNLEVLDAYMKQPSMLFRGKVRPVHLSENGFNSKDYSDKSLEDQAAGMAYAWKKIQSLSSIEMWHYHNWIDNRKEGGLRIGLRKFSDEKNDPLGKKPIWHLYKSLGTNDEESACQPYLKTIGIENWNITSDASSIETGIAKPAKDVQTKVPVSKRPNVLVILTEDQGAHMGAIGTPGLQTPHMDALARSGTLFRNTFVAYPVCSASKAALYTGMQNHANGILNNTVNYHTPASRLTDAQKQHVLYRTNRIRSEIPTLVEILHDAGYYQGVTHKLHVVPNEKFPYDEFIATHNKKTATEFIKRAQQAGKPWHLFFNIPNSHRPFPNSDKVKIRVDPDQVKPPAFLPDTPVIRQDWSEYLAAIEAADVFVGQVLEALRESGQANNTYVVFLGDHGPCFVHGKMTLYDLGLRVPCVLSGPGLPANETSQALVSELDILPTLLDLLELPPLASTHGVSIRDVVEKKSTKSKRDYVFSEISNRGVLPNAGMQERSVTDGIWRFIYREKVETRWRQVQADSKDWSPWGNRSYEETIRVKDQFPEAYRMLKEFDPQNLDGHTPQRELYHLTTDPDEINNRASDPDVADQEERLFQALKAWGKATADPLF